ncbi:MAG: excinuclease ABC subunit UvrA [Opitutales bacterium]|nr:excinuclease ABC subunit UvrA [Opitutales bacterium]
MTPKPEKSPIRLRDLRQNNLHIPELDLPRGELIVVTGLSGTGKSSLVFDTLHAEGQRRYVETFSAYTRQFLDLLQPPQVGEISGIPPSIAIEQTNTVKTSRSTVGTMTELCDFFKVWFQQVAALHDPETGEIVEDDSPDSLTGKILDRFADETVLVTFRLPLPASLPLAEALANLRQQGYSRLVAGKKVLRLEDWETKAPQRHPQHLEVIQDRLAISAKSRSRLLEAVRQALHFGRGEVHLYTADKPSLLASFAEGLRTPGGKSYRPSTPSLFSFNSPVGACPTCRGFGRVIEIDYRLAIPDGRLSLREGAIKAWQGEVYQECQREMLTFCRREGIPVDVPWEDLSQEEQNYIIYGEPGYGEDGREWPHAWYGLKGFFDWMETKVYKMHVRVFLSRYRTYKTCPDCHGDRLQPEALCWKWQGHTLPDLYRMPIRHLRELLRPHAPAATKPGDPPLSPGDNALAAILTRLGYLDEVGVGYLTLDRTSRTLSGGEVERVNLTSCLGTSLVETLFVLDEPSVGLHARDLDRLIRILQRLRDQGNTVVVVEHDEAVMRAADTLLEVGPKPGKEGGRIVYQGSPAELAAQKPDTVNARYLLGANTMDPPPRRPVKKPARGARPENWVLLEGLTKHNLHHQTLTLPTDRLVALSGVSGSGKSTLLRNGLFEGWKSQRGLVTDDPATFQSLHFPASLEEVVLVDQSPLSRTPRSNPALYTGAWEEIRKLYASTELAKARGMTPATFSFNSGNGRCEHCNGLGYEKVEMQFLSDVFVPCPVCEGRRFKNETLEVTWQDQSVDEILGMTIDESLLFFAQQPKIHQPLALLQEVGLGYLTLGQPLNTLSGGEAQRLKLVKYLSSPKPSSRRQAGAAQRLLLLDEPTTGLHRHDIRRLLTVLHRLVDQGQGVVVIEHQTDVLCSADWLIELGPGAGDQGGRIVAAGTPAQMARRKTETAPFLREALAALRKKPKTSARSSKKESPPTPLAQVAETSASYQTPEPPGLILSGAREHNLRNLSLTIPYHQLTVVTGVSGSGKSTLAFDIIFAEGQRRFMESMSAYARQFVEQMPKPEIDSLTGIPPTVAIEQRVSRGGRKSTVATITEVAQYLRLLYARLGTQHSPVTGQPVISLSPEALWKNFCQSLPAPGKKNPHLYLCAPLIRGRKGHHEPVAKWLAAHHYHLMRCDGRLQTVESFRKLERYREHDIEAVIATLARKPTDLPESEGETPPGTSSSLNAWTLCGESPRERFDEALRIGKGTCFLLDTHGQILRWFSTGKTDPATGESFPDLDPKHFSFNSPRGWCPTCRGYGRLYDWMQEHEDFPPEAAEGDHGQVCPTCQGDRLNETSRAVRLPLKDGTSRSLPELLRLTARELLSTIRTIKLDTRGKRIGQDLFPQIEERLRFLDRVGLDYLTLDRGADTLSGGEAQRIRLAAQLGSNLSGVLYVLDEPSIGLHARDNDRLIESLHQLRDRGNTLLVVEHDEDTMRAADQVIDLGPGAGRNGGELLAAAPLDQLLDHPRSLTGKYLREGIAHPLLGQYRPLEPLPGPGRPYLKAPWTLLRAPSLRNLKGDDLYLPHGRLTMVGGVSGAGKSTLFRELLQSAVQVATARKKARLKGSVFQKDRPDLTSGETSPPFEELVNGHRFQKIIEVDQSPIGKTPRSTPATYLGAFDLIRQFFANLPESRMRGYTASTFSFNTKGGRCETCQGAGRIKIEMNFLPDTYVTCEDCHGSRYAPELRDLRWNGKSIGEVLAMSFAEATECFAFHQRLQGICQLMVDTGLGYLSLGQSSPTLSGGEAQRLKLVSELARGLPSLEDRKRGRRQHNLYLLEEPTIGLHFRDCERLIRVLHQLVDQGHTVVVIEHHLDLLAEADYFVEIGPDGGNRGGQILFQGPLSQYQKHQGPSPTRPYLLPKIS